MSEHWILSDDLFFVKNASCLGIYLDVIQYIIQLTLLYIVDELYHTL